MNDESTFHTSINLLNRARERDGNAWKRMVDIYSPLVSYWARRAGLQESDVADVTQDVFQILFRSLERFRKEKPGDTFRGWLWTITRNELRRFFRKQSQREQPLGGPDGQSHLLTIPDWIDNEVEDVTIDAKTEKEMLVRAAYSVRGNFSEHTWRAFWRAAVDRAHTADIAAELGMKPNAVRQAKFRVLARLREILE